MGRMLKNLKRIGAAALAMVLVMAYLPAVSERTGGWLPKELDGAVPVMADTTDVWIGNTKLNPDVVP